MVSRLLMVVQYATIIWHVRKYQKAKLPLSLMVGLHFVAAMIYLGITFRFRDYNSRVYIAWYIIAVLETALSVGFSLVWDVLSFKGTHLVNRMSLLTLIIIGEGIIVVCTNVTTIVKNPNSWSKSLKPTNLFDAWLTNRSWRNDWSDHSRNSDNVYCLSDILRLAETHPPTTHPSALLGFPPLPLPLGSDTIR